MASPNASHDRIGMAWLLGDMAQATMVMALVKIEGTSYPAIQLVFIRSLIGLVSVLPLAWRHWAEIRGTKRVGGHALRVTCNTLALTCNFAALTALPLALVNAIGFMRPLVVLVFAVLLLGERVSVMRWLGTAFGFVGVLIMVAPGSVPFDLGLAAAFGAVLFGSLAVVQTRALRTENTTVLMVFYTVGLSLITAIPAVLSWQSVALDDWPTLLAIGVLSQIGQYCFLRAYQSTPANILAPLGYLSIVLATMTGYFVFGEIPAWTTLLGVIVILIALQLTNVFDRRKL